MLYYKCVPAQKARKGTIFFLFIQIKRHKSAKTRRKPTKLGYFFGHINNYLYLCGAIYKLKDKHTKNENYENEQLF